MNATITKFGYPATLIKEYSHWLVLLRPLQPTLGSLILAAKGDAVAFGNLPAAAHGELAVITKEIEAVLTTFVGYEKLNYLMLMMADPHVHFHIIPRYDGARRWGNIDFVDHGWQGLPGLGDAVALDPTAIADLVALIKQEWLSRAK